MNTSRSQPCADGESAARPEAAASMEDRIEAARFKVRHMLHAADNANHLGERAVLRMAASAELLAEAAELCAILDNHAAHDGETLVYDFEAIGEEVARRHEGLTDAIAKATGQ